MGTDLSGDELQDALEWRQRLDEIEEVEDD
jgi:hypothetical protein